jgi:valyl-tRNA synthetase
VALRLLHPIMPFITETLWRRLPDRHPAATIMYAPWPAPDRRAEDSRAVEEFAAAQEVVGAIRSIRAEYAVQPGQLVRARITRPTATTRSALRQLRLTVQRLARVSELAVVNDGEREDGDGATAVLTRGEAVTVPLGDLIDAEKECARLTQEALRVRSAVSAQERKLGNEQFVARAPAEIVQKERDKLVAWRDQIAALEDKRRRLGCAG